MSNEKGIDPKKLNAMKMKILKAEQEKFKNQRQNDRSDGGSYQKDYHHRSKKRVLRRCFNVN